MIPLSMAGNSTSSQPTLIRIRRPTSHLISSHILSLSLSSGRVMAHALCGHRHRKRWILSHSVMSCRSSRMSHASGITMMLARCPCCQLTTKYRYQRRVRSRVLRRSHRRAVLPSHMPSSPCTPIPIPVPVPIPIPIHQTPPSIETIYLYLDFVNNDG